MNWIAIWVTFKLAALDGADPSDRRTAHRLLGEFFALAVEVHCRVGGGTAVGAATDCAGFYILVAIGPHSPFGRFYNELVGHPLPFTFEGSCSPPFSTVCHLPCNRSPRRSSRSIGD